MRLVGTSADCILELAFQAESGSLIIHGERNDRHGYATLTMAAPDEIVSLRPLPFDTAALAPNGRLIAGIDPKGALLCRDLDSDSEWRLHRLRSNEMRLTFSADSRFLFGLCNRSMGRTMLLRCPTGRRDSATFDTIANWFHAFAVHPSGNIIAIYESSQRITLARFDGEGEKDTWPPGHDEQELSCNWAGRILAMRSWPLNLNVHDIRFSPDGRLLACAAGAHVALWDVEERRQIHALISHAGMVTSMVFNASGSQIITGSHDRSVRIWDVSTGRLLRTYCWPIGPVLAVALSQDELMVAAGDNAGHVVLWDLD